MLVMLFRYGLGMIYYKQEKFSLAEMHFQKALDINPQSSVLLCHIGVVSILLSCIVGALPSLMTGTSSVIHWAPFRLQPSCS